MHILSKWHKMIASECSIIFIVNICNLFFNLTGCKVENIIDQIRSGRAKSRTLIHTAVDFQTRFTGLKKISEKGEFI